jgi:hypothetical protein
MLYADLAPLLRAPSAGPGRDGELPAEASIVEVRDAAGTVRGELVVLDVTSALDGGRRGLQHVSAVLLVRTP